MDKRFLTKGEFAAECGLVDDRGKPKTNYLANDIKRGNVLLNKDGMIDVYEGKNQIYLTKKKGRNSTARMAPKSDEGNTPTMVSAGAIVKIEVPGLGIVEVPDYADSERVLKYLDTLKRDKETKLLEIREAKLRGEVVPTELISIIFLQHNHSILTQMKTGIEELLRKIGKTYDFSPADLATYKGESVALLNQAIQTAAENSAKSVGAVIEEYSQKRGVGEKI